MTSRAGSAEFLAELQDVRASLVSLDEPFVSVAHYRFEIGVRMAYLQYHVTRRLPLDADKIEQALVDIIRLAVCALAYTRDPQSSVATALDIVDEMVRLHRKKSADYGLESDVFANVRASSAWGLKPWVGALVRASDKVQRIDSFAVKGSLANEPIEDAWIDLACYATIALVLFREDCK